MDKDLEKVHREKDDPAINHALRKIAKEFGVSDDIQPTSEDLGKWVTHARNLIDLNHDSAVKLMDVVRNSDLGLIPEKTGREAEALIGKHYSSIDELNTLIYRLDVKGLKEIYDQQGLLMNGRKEYNEKRIEIAPKLEAERNIVALVKTEKEIADTKDKYKRALDERLRRFNVSMAIIEQSEAQETKTIQETLVRNKMSQHSQDKLKELAIVEEKNRIAKIIIGQLYASSIGEIEVENNRKMADLEKKREEILQNTAEQNKSSKGSEHSSENVKMVGNTIVDQMIESRQAVAVIEPSGDRFAVDARLKQIRQNDAKGIDRIKQLNAIIDDIAGRDITPENLAVRAGECRDIEQYLGKFVKEFEQIHDSYDIMKEDQKVTRRLYKKWENRKAKADKAIAEAKAKGLSHKAHEMEKLREMADATSIQMKKNLTTLDGQMEAVKSLIHESNMAKTKLLSIIVSCNRFVRDYSSVVSPDGNAVKMLSVAFKNITNYEDSMLAGKGIGKSKQMLELT